MKVDNHSGGKRNAAQLPKKQTCKKYNEGNLHDFRASM